VSMLIFEQALIILIILILILIIHEPLNILTQTLKCSRSRFIILRVTVDFCEQWLVLRVTESSTNSLRG